jgi:hypothetical protein
VCCTRRNNELCHSITQLNPCYASTLSDSLVSTPLHFSWTPSLPSPTRLLLLLAIVLIENASLSPDSPQTLQLPSQRIFALKSPLTTDHQIIQRAPTKPTPTPAIPLPRTPSFHLPHPVLVGYTHTGDAAPFRQPCHPPRILT